MDARQASAELRNRFCGDCGASLLQPENVSKPLRFCERCGQPQYSEPQNAKKASPLAEKRGKTLGKTEASATARVSRRNWIVAAALTVALGGTSFGITRLFVEKPQPAAHGQQDAQAGANSNAAGPVPQELLDASARLQDSLSRAPGDKNLALRAANSLYDLGSAYQQQNAVFLAKTAFAKAEKLYEGYLAFDPKNTAARVDYAYALLSLGKTDEAIAQTKQALEYEPQHSVALFNLGVIYARLQQYDEARRWLEQAKKNAPDSEISRQSDRLMEGFPKTGGS